MSYNTQQLQMQSLLLSGLVPSHDHNFASSLAYWTGNLSMKQQEFLDKILDRILNPGAPSNSVGALTVDVSNIMKMMNTAHDTFKMKWPKFWVQTADGTTVKVALGTGIHSGTLKLSTGSYGNGRYFGSVTDKGEARFTRQGREKSDALIKVLTEFNSDPVGVATKYGKLMNACCFCHLPLSTPQSLAVGYGDTCAKHYGLPWGTETVTKKDVTDTYTANTAAADAAQSKQIAAYSNMIATVVDTVIANGDPRDTRPPSLGGIRDRDDRPFGPGGGDWDFGRA